MESSKQNDEELHTCPFLVFRKARRLRARRPRKLSDFSRPGELFLCGLIAGGAPESSNYKIRPLKTIHKGGAPTKG
jgi:hypothetical protein